jgi:hypothetical protein
MGIVVMIMMLIWGIWIQTKVAKLIKKVEDILETARKTSEDVKDFIERTIAWLETFKKSIFTFEFIRQIIVNIINFIKNNSKGKKDGEENREVE